jgi:hypothetical protein
MRSIVFGCWLQTTPRNRTLSAVMYLIATPYPPSLARGCRFSVSISLLSICSRQNSLMLRIFGAIRDEFKNRLSQKTRPQTTHETSKAQ